MGVLADGDIMEVYVLGGRGVLNFQDRKGCWRHLDWYLEAVAAAQHLCVGNEWHQNCSERRVESAEGSRSAVVLAHAGYCGRVAPFGAVYGLVLFVVSLCTITGTRVQSNK